MKTFTGLLLFVTLGIVANGQTGGSKVIAEISASSESVVKGSPFSADAVSESVQVLADGNRISRSSTSKLYRNGEGQFRRELAAGTSGTFFGTTVYSDLAPSTFILDPVGGYRYFLNENSKTIRATSISPSASGGGNNRAAVSGRILQVEKGQIEAAAAQAAGGGSAAMIATAPMEGARAVIATRAPMAEGGVSFFSGVSPASGNTKTEELGTRNIEGVDTEGKRTVTTIEAGAIGNERPIEIVYERWYSKELQLVVQSRHYDPRFGEQSYRLTNINRSEPDPSLFSLPTEYKMLREPTTVYRSVTPRPIATRATPARVITLAPAAKP